MSAAPPAGVREALARAEAAGFELSCEDGVGRLLAALAAAVPHGGRVVELGTGAGVGTAWLRHGLGARSDALLVTVDVDATLQQRVREGGWPAWVRFEVGDGAERVARDAPWDLVFADAPGGKLHGLDASVAALRPGGVLLVDDMDLARHDDADLRAALADVARTLHADDRLVCAELDCASGVLLATRVR